MDTWTGPLFVTLVFTIISIVKFGDCLENVAQGKNATQSGTHGSYTADKAVDGKKGPLMGSNQCAHPQTNGNDVLPEDRDKAAWWRVDLGKEYDVYGVKIYNRDYLRERLSNTWVLVSNEERPDIINTNICKEIVNGQRAVVDVACDYVTTRKFLRGRYVMLQRRDNANQRRVMNFCEVEVFSCNEDRWGRQIPDGDCSQQCHCFNETCSISDGYCSPLSICKFGLWGDRCDEPCHCAEGKACNRSTQKCPADECQSGYGGHNRCIKALPRGNIRNATYDQSTNKVTISFDRWTRFNDDDPGEVEKYKLEVQYGDENTWIPLDMPLLEITSPSLLKIEIPSSYLQSDTEYRFRIIPVFIDNDHDVDGIASEKSNSILIPSPKEITTTPTNAGLLAGIVVAVIVLIILIIIVIVLIIRYRKSGKQVDNKQREGLAVSSQPDHAYENPIVTKENGDTLQSVEVDEKYEVPTTVPIVNGIVKPPSRSATPEVLPSGDEEEQIYANPMTIPAIKVSDLSSYIEKHKGEVDAFKREYQQLPAGDKAKWEVGNKAENRNKNRFVNIRAYDHSRVVLTVEDGDIHSDYINADFITGYKDKPKVYVAAQGPKKSTVVDTWRMLWELNANRIVMVTNVVEGGKVKCEQYWPDTEEQYGMFSVKTTSNEIYADFSIKQFKVVHKDETRTVHHLHFTSWPDHGVPITATALLNFRRKVRSYDDMATGPLVVHCSAGVGRTGTFIALDYLLQQAKEEDEVDVYGYCCVMRSNRVNMIQTLEQYIFVYDGLLEALMSGDTSIPCPELAERYEKMKKVDPELKKTKLQYQFDVLQVLKPAKREEKLTALEPDNIKKNRDVEIVPSNRFRPFLSIKVEGCSDYINAVYVDGYKMRLAYIITQSPLPNTISDIWRLAYDHASRTIVMLNQLSEDDDNCPVYWPTEKDTPLVFKPLTVTLVDETVDSVTPSITVRDFSIVHSSKPNNAVIVKQFHLTNWAEGEMLPESTKDLLDVMDLVERWQQQSANGPVTIHCSNGSDKSALYCAASYTVEKLKLDREVDVFHAVKHVRVCRSSAVPSMEQYMYLHELALEYIDKFEIYANFK